MNIEKIQSELRKKMDAKRFHHTMGVMYTASALAMQEGISIEDAMYAGLLHDCGKIKNTDKQYKMCKKYDIQLNDIEKENPSLIHAKLGAYLAKTHYGIENDNIINAIWYHTTGKPNMNTLEKIIYVSDYIEPHRELPAVDEIRKLAFQNLDEALYQILKLSIEHLENSNKLIDNMTVKTYEYYNKLNGGKEYGSIGTSETDGIYSI